MLSIGGTSGFNPLIAEKGVLHLQHAQKVVCDQISSAIRWPISAVPTKVPSPVYRSGVR